MKGVKSSLRFISNLFFSYWAKNRFTLAEGRKIVASLHFQFIFFLLGENRFASFLTFFCLIGEYQVYQEFIFFLLGEKSLRIISDFFCFYWRIPSLPRIPRIYQEYQEHT